ncbi:MAG: hypothetical protein PHT64_03415 [Bacteroidales bacterium]|nr:hypothetical protein [Bacteroidales bacterium]MDD4029917.1 hypothetical protein [Bacteroidales bacterium]MDD5732828.1 hypothetical protein [Bacteroidales bacterium]
MKRIGILALLLFSTLFLFAQRPYFCITEGTTLEYENYGQTGNVDGYFRMNIRKVSGIDGNYTINYVMTPFNPDRTPSFDPVEMTTSIKDGAMSAMFGSVSLMEVSGDIPVIPSLMAVGQELGGGLMKISAMGLNFTAEILSHNVIGREELTTPAGTFKCYIVEMVTQSNVLMQKVVSTTRQWYTRGIGSVKSETFDDSGKMTNSQLLIKIN